MDIKNECVVGIDWGTKRIGLAICSKGVTFALPSKTIEAKASDKETVQLILKTISESIDRFALGLPIFLDGTESEMTKRVRLFAKALEEEGGKPVHLIDERLTSEESEDLLKELGQNRKERAKHKDSLSAQIILKDFISTIL